MGHTDAVEVEESQRPPVPSPRAHGPSNEYSSTSFRTHPYTRRPSLPTPETDYATKLQLPPPNVGGQLRSEVPRQPPSQTHPVNIPSISSLVSGSSSWRRESDRDRFWEDRTDGTDRRVDGRPPVGRSVSGGSSHSVRPSLPPLHTLGVSEPTSNTPTPTSVHTPLSFPPPTRHRARPLSPHFGYSRPSSSPPPPAHDPMSSRHPHQPVQDVRQYNPARSAMFGRSAPRETSPPLRAVQGGYDAPAYQHQHRYSDAYQQHAPNYRDSQGHRLHPQVQIDPYTGHPLQQSGLGIPMRRLEEERQSSSSVQVPGQSRRLAHLMSEQKRRESINTGFQALRKVVPAASPTDSKAVILRKAAAHIAHLEALIRNGDHVARSSNRPFEIDEPMGPVSDEDVDVDDEDDDAGSDNGRRSPIVVKVEDTEVSRW